MKLPDHLPVPDECAHLGCRFAQAAHVGLLHPFLAPAPSPNPAKVVEAEIQTSWTCWNCAQVNDVGGVASGWMECSACGEGSFLV